MLRYILPVVFICCAVAVAGDDHGCEPYQVWSCGDNCNRKCFDFLNRDKPEYKRIASLRCPRYACVDGNSACVCDTSYGGEGYWLNESTGECVQASECKDDSTATTTDDDDGFGDLIRENNKKHGCGVGQTWSCSNNCNSKCSDYSRRGDNSLWAQIACPTYACGDFNSACVCDRYQDYWLDETTNTCVRGHECPNDTVTSNTKPERIIWDE